MDIEHSTKKTAILFIHIPKTAGTSVSKLLQSTQGVNLPLAPRWRALHWGKGPGKHACSLEKKRHLGRSFERAFKFSVVRNSWDWLWSFYSFIKFTKLSPDNGRAFRHPLYPIVKDLSFSEFVEFVTIDNGLEKLPVARRMASLGYQDFNQYNFVHNLNGDLLVDRILHFEHIEEQMRHLFFDLGLPIPSSLPEVNISKKFGKKYQDVYSSSTRRLVENTFKKDIEKFEF